MTQGTDLDRLLHGSPLTDADSWWAGESDDVEGYDFIKDAALFSLVGVPFKAFTLTYRSGIQQKGTPWRNDYVSIELRIAPAPIIVQQFDRIMSRRTDDLIADKKAIPLPGEQLGVNSGSTGIYRQTVQALVLKELITLPEDLPETGKKNECRYDLPASMFVLTEAGHDACSITTDAEGHPVTAFELARPLGCMRGLRFSKYDNEFAGADGAITWYIA